MVQGKEATTSIRSEHYALIDSETKVVAVCPDCGDLGWNAVLHLLTSDDHVAFLAMEQVIRQHEVHYGHQVDFVRIGKKGKKPVLLPYEH